jgi:hypothetical protein
MCVLCYLSNNEKWLLCLFPQNLGDTPLMNRRSFSQVLVVGLHSLLFLSFFPRTDGSVNTTIDTSSGGGGRAGEKVPSPGGQTPPMEWTLPDSAITPITVLEPPPVSEEEEEGEEGAPHNALPVDQLVAG